MSIKLQAALDALIRAAHELPTMSAVKASPEYQRFTDMLKGVYND